MKDYTKTTIRIKRAAKKLSEKVYPSTPGERDIIKLNEQYEILQKSIDKTWGIIFNMGFVPERDNSNPFFFDFFDDISNFQKMCENISRKICRLEKKYKLKEEEVMRNFYKMNAGRGSVSF